MGSRESAEAESMTMAEALTMRNATIKKIKTKYRLIPTMRRGFEIKTVEDSKPDLSDDDVRTLVSTTALYHRLRGFIIGKEKVQQTRGETLKGIAAAHPGVRGVVARQDGYVQNIHPRTSIQWSQEGLQQELGIGYDEVVTDTIVATITLPRGALTNEGPLDETIAKRLLYLGCLAIGLESGELSDTDVAPVISAKAESTVAIPTLFDMFANGQIADIEKTGTASRTWVLSEEPLGSQ